MRSTQLVVYDNFVGQTSQPRMPKLATTNKGLEFTICSFTIGEKELLNLCREMYSESLLIMIINMDYMSI